MEHCKYCQAELEEGNTICPGCGKDNADMTEELRKEEAPAVEEAPAAEEPKGEVPSAEIKKGYQVTPGKLALAIAAVVVLISVLVALVISGMDKSVLIQNVDDAVQNAESTGTVGETTQTITPTIPADGNPDDETCKGSYTASDEEVLAAKDVVIATAGEHELTLGQLQIYYWQEVAAWLNQYGSYAIYFGLDATQPLDVQSCQLLEGRTWQQYFLMRALNSWQTYLAMDIAAEEAGYELEQEYVDVLNALPENMEAEAVSSGFENAQALMEYNVGVGSNVEEYVEFMEIYYHANTYYMDFSEGVTATPEEVEELFLLHEEEYAEAGLTRDTKTVNVRHILIYPEGATSETIRTEIFSEEAWAAGKAAAEDVLAQWDGTEEGFAALAGEYSQDPGSASNGGLYTDVSEGQMVTNFDAWCFDPERQVGDSDIVETEFGYHIMYYSGDTLQWPILVEADVISEKINSMVEDAVGKYPLTVDYSKILLSLAGVFNTAAE